MSDTSLVFNLIARDKLSPELQKTEGKFSKLKNTIKSFAGPLAAIGAAEVLKGWMEKAEQAEVVTKVTEQRLKSTGEAAHVSAKQVEELGFAISNKTGIDHKAIQSGENLMLTFTGIRNEVGKGNDIFNQATKASVDLAAAMHHGTVDANGLKMSTIQIGKALQDPIKGITALQRVGVSFSKGQKEQIANYVKMGQKTKAQKLILHELGKEFGGTAAASATPMKKLQNEISNVGEKLGAVLLPPFDAFVNKLVSFVDFYQKHSSWMGPLVLGLGGLVVVITAVTKATKLWRDAQALLNIVMDANPVALVVLAIAALVAGVVMAYNHFKTFREIVRTVGAVAVNIFRGILDMWMTVAGGILHGAAVAFGWVPGLGGKLKSADKAFGDFKTSVDNKLKSVSKALMDANANEDKMAKVRKLNVDINQWQSALNKAKSQMKSVPAGKRAELKAKISQLEDKIRRAKAEIASVHGKTVTITAKIKASQVSIASSSNRILSSLLPGHASGGIVGSGGTMRRVIVGENGPEIADLPSGTRVHTARESAYMSGTSPAQPMQITLQIGDQKLGELLVDPIKKTVRNRGGNVQAVFGG